MDAPAPLAVNAVPNNEDDVKSGEQKEETLRTYFPDIWIWELVSVG